MASAILSTEPPSEALLSLLLDPTATVNEAESLSGASTTLSWDDEGELTEEQDGLSDL